MTDLILIAACAGGVILVYGAAICLVGHITKGVFINDDGKIILKDFNK